MAIKNQELFASQRHAAVRSVRLTDERERLHHRRWGDREPARGSPGPGHRGQRPDAPARACRRAEPRRPAHQRSRRPPAQGHATADPDELPPFGIGIIATKAAGLEGAVESLAGRFPDATIVTTLNGLGAEEVVRAARRLADRLRGDVHQRDEALGHACRVRPRYGDVAWPVRGHAVRARRGDRRAHRSLRAQGRGASRPPSRAVVEADLQRDGELGRGGHGPRARSPLRRRGAARRSRPSRSRPHRRGQGGRGRGRDRAPRRSLGDERSCHAAGSTHTPSMLEDVEAQASRRRSTSSPGRSSARPGGTVSRFRCIRRWLGSSGRRRRPGAWRRVQKVSSPIDS